MVSIRMLGTNRLLQLMGLSDSDSCTFCHISIETISHLFWECHHIDSFWRSLKQWINTNFRDVFMNWSKSDTILGNRAVNKQSNILLLLAKQFIFKSKLKKHLPNLDNFKPVLKSYILSERYYAIQSGSNDKFMKLWGNFASLWL